ncbi:MAG: Ig-like domain-containing protein [Eubacterium sp.]|nr:Ig-like domain-containing protein [Eubacterium sp.]
MNKKIFKQTLMVLLFALFIVGTWGVTEANAATTKLSKKSVTFTEKGATKKIKLKNASGTVKWKSTDKSVAKVSSTGKITAVHSGTCYITATCNKKTYKCKVTVKYDGELTFYYNNGFNDANILNYLSVKYQVQEKYGINLGKGTVVSSNESVLTPNEDMDLVYGDSTGKTLLTITKQNGTSYTYKTNIIDTIITHEDFDFGEYEGYTNFIDSEWRAFVCELVNEEYCTGIFTYKGQAVSKYDKYYEGNNEQDLYELFEGDIKLHGITIGSSIKTAINKFGYGNIDSNELWYAYTENDARYILSFRFDSEKNITSSKFYKLIQTS